MKPHMRMQGNDRYGGVYPDTDTMCKGQCEGMGRYPQNIRDPDITPEERKAWETEDAAATPERRAEAVRDGVYFIVCPDCKGTGLRHEPASE